MFGLEISILVNVLGLNGNGMEAVQLFNSIPTSDRDGWMFVCTLNACSHGGLIEQAEQIFAEIPINQRTEQIYTAMVEDL